jgi:DNA mismatch repair ATPase MutL
MSEETVVTLNVQEDFAEKLASGRPAQAIAELIWNGLDAEATRITVSAEDGELGLQAIVVEDNGHGIPPADAPKLSGGLPNGL